MKCNESIQGRGLLASLCAALTVLAASLNSTTTTTPKSCSSPPSFSLVFLYSTCHRGRVLDYIDSLWHASSCSSSQTEFLSFLPYYNNNIIIIITFVADARQLRLLSRVYIGVGHCRAVLQICNIQLEYIRLVGYHQLDQYEKQEIRS